MANTKEEWLTLTWKNNQTCYQVHLEEDLFGHWWLTKVKHSEGKEDIKKEACNSYQDGIKRIGHIKYHYEKLGFVLV